MGRPPPRAGAGAPPPPPPPPPARRAAACAAGSLIVAVTYSAVVAVRYAQRRVREIPGAGLAPTACCQCLWTASAAIGRIALPIVYSCVVLYDTSLVGGARWSLKLAASSPALVAATLAAVALFGSLQVAACVSAGVVAACFAAGRITFGTVALAATAARVTVWVAVSPYRACAYASLVARCSMEAGELAHGVEHEPESKEVDAYSDTELDDDGARAP
jgi:hypothetical protein